jgi:holo-[acyl-carrier protein] synthase
MINTDASGARSSVGVDLVEVRRIARLAARRGGLTGVLTAAELAACEARPRPAEHMAGRIAAKEAVLKALGTGLAEGIHWTDVEVVNDPRGRPEVFLRGRAAAVAAANGLAAVEVSISHTADLAMAHAVATWAPVRQPLTRSKIACPTRSSHTTT